MLSLLFLAYAVIHIGIWIWGWKLWSETGRPVSLLLVLVGGTLLFYDNLRIGMGRFIGEGDLLYALSTPAFAWHWSMLPLLVIAAGSVTRQADLGWARSRFAMGAFCLVAVALSIHDIPKIFSMQLYPACLADTLRYTTAVSEFQVCPGGTVIAQTAGAEAALVAIITNIIVLGVGIALWIRRRWPWMAGGAGVMFICAGAFAGSPWSLPIANFGEICITLGLILTCAHFARLAQGPRKSPAQAMRQAA
ncbi:MAG: hypothetical protein FJ197_00910 [Gammaproteobacteria bacterium]|nr:hypothetical protein [Gammaproteobacteria bacterium]